MTSYRVGALQFLVLGALSQSPSGTLTAAQLRTHFNSNRMYFSLSPVLYGLLGRGLIAASSDDATFTITASGGEARAAKAREGEVRFLKLSTERLMREGGVAC